MKRYLLIILLVLICFGCNNKDNELKCFNGYVLEDNKCKKEIDNTIAEVSYYCDPTYELKDYKCKKYTEMPIKEKEGCDEGIKEENGKCIGTLTKDVIVKYKCEKGTERDKKCYTKKVKAEALTRTYTCLAGYTKQGSICVKDSDPNVTKAPKTTYSCAEGTSLANGRCYVEELVGDAKEEKTCPDGYELKDNKCLKNVNENIKKIKYCDDGFVIKNNKCVKDENLDAKKNYKCPDTYIYENGLCRKYDYQELK